MELELSHNRFIPSEVKSDVYKRDEGNCVICGAKDNLHYDLDFPFAKGGSSITSENIRILCARHNLEKSDKIFIIHELIFDNDNFASKEQEIQKSFEVTIWAISFSKTNKKVGKK